MKNVKRIIITTKAYIPEKKVDREILEKHFLHRFYNEVGCSKCPLVQDRPVIDCYECPNYKGEIQLWQEKTVKGEDYIALPPGNLEQIQHLLRLNVEKIDDRRPILPLKYKLKFTGKLFEGNVINSRQTVNQKDIVKKWMETKNGVIIAPPRAGKTAMAVAITCQMNVKTLIVCHQSDFLRQFYTTFVGDKKKNKPAMTNVLELREKTGKRIVGIVEKPEDLLRYDCALLTYQKFIKQETAMERIAQFLKGRFSLLVIDELHRGAASAFAKFLSRLDCKYRLGLTATFDRKDGRSIVLNHLVGPIVATAQSSSLIPTIKIVETGLTTKYNYRIWVHAMKFIGQNKKRTDLILNEIFKDYKNGHKCIIIPVDYKAQAFAWKKLIDARAHDEGLQNNFAEVFHAGCDRKKILSNVDSGKTPVLISIRSMITMGIDLSRPSMIYIVVPMSANEVGAPMFYQLSHRVSTWMQDKKPPVVKVFVDAMPQSYGCWRSLFWKEIHPNLGRNGKEPRYKMLDADYQRGIMIAGARKYEPPLKLGERLTSKQILKKLGVKVNTNSQPVKKAKTHF